jgi:hypothetical protein
MNLASVCLYNYFIVKKSILELVMSRGHVCGFAVDYHFALFASVRCNVSKYNIFIGRYATLQQQLNFISEANSLKSFKFDL